MKVTIYTTPTCQWCFRTKEFFRENSVDYSEVDVSADYAAAEEMVRKSGQMGVPVTIIEDNTFREHVVIGFDEESLTKYLHVDAE